MCEARMRDNPFVSMRRDGLTNATNAGVRRGRTVSLYPLVEPQPLPSVEALPGRQLPSSISLLKPSHLASLMTVSECGRGAETLLCGCHRAGCILTRFDKHVLPWKMVCASSSDRFAPWCSNSVSHIHVSMTLCLNVRRYRRSWLGMPRDGRANPGAQHRFRGLRPLRVQRESLGNQGGCARARLIKFRMLEIRQDR